MTLILLLIVVELAIGGMIDGGQRSAQNRADAPAIWRD